MLRPHSQIVVPEGGGEEGHEGPATEEDAADRDARHRAAAEARRQLDLLKRSAVLQRGLPRPPRAPPAPPAAAATPEDLIQREVGLLVAYENAKFPLPAGKGGAGRPVVDAAALQYDLRDVTPEALLAAADLIRAESGPPPAIDPAAFAAAQAAARASLTQLHHEARLAPAESLAPADRLASLQAAFESARRAMEEESRRAAKLEHKFTVLTTGYQNREAKLELQLQALLEELQEAREGRACFRHMQAREGAAGPGRVAAIRALRDAQATRETALQARFKQLETEKRDLRRGLATLMGAQ